MLDVAQLNAAMSESARLWGENQTSEALQILDEWIEGAERENEIGWVDVLCGQASMIAGSMDDLGLVRMYCEKILSHKGETTFDWAMAHYRLADAMFRHGEIDLARQHATKSYALVAHPTNDYDRGLVELLVKLWPEITSWTP